MEKSKNMNISIGRLILTLLMVLIVVVGGTFAWLTYSSKESALVLTIGDINDTQIKLSPYQIKGTMTPVNTYTSGVYSEVEVVNGGGKDTSVTLFYKVNELDQELIDNGLKYTITSSSSQDGTYSEVKTGDFTEFSGQDEALILDTDTEKDSTIYYRVYLWVDSSEGEQSAIQNSTLDVELNGSIGSVTISGTNTYGSVLTANVVDSSATATYTYQWFSNTTNSTTGGTALTEATSSNTYTIGSELVGKYIYVVANVVEDYYEDRVYTDIIDTTVSRKEATMTVTPTSLSIRYPTSGTFTYTYDGDGVVSCSSSDENVAICSINTTTKTVTVTPQSAPGNVTITLSAAQGTDYNAVSKTVSVTVAKGTQTGGAVTISGENIYGETLTAIVEATDQGSDEYTYQWWYSPVYNSNSTSRTNISGATGSTYTIGSGLVGKWIGVTVTAKKDNYNDRMLGSWTLNSVSEASSSITVISNPTIYVTETQDISELVSNVQGTLSYEIKSQTTSGSTISGKTLTAGVLSASNDDDGEVIVTVTDDGGSNYTSSSVDVTVTVQKYTPTLTWSSTTPSSVTYGDTSKSATVTVSVNGGTKGAVTYSSGDTDSLTINSSTGALTPVAYSTGVTITASLARTTTVKVGSTTKSIAVARATGNIELSETTGTIIYGTASKTFTVKSHHGGTLSVSDNHSTATVSISDSTVTIANLSTASAGGTITVTVTSGQTAQYNAASATYKLTINKAATATTGSCKTGLIYSGSAQTLASGATNATYTNNSGTNAGDYTVKVTAGSNYTFSDGETSKTLSCSIGQADGYVELSATTGTITYGTTSKTFTVDSHHGGTLSVSDDNSTASSSISSSTVTIGSLGSLNAGTSIKVTVTSGATTNYKSASATYTLTINKATGSCTVEITGTNTYDQTLTATITTSSDGTKGYNWYKSSGNMPSGGTSLGVTTQTYKIGSGLAGQYIYVSATVGEGTNYTAATCKDITDDSTNTTATVAKKTPTITVSPTSLTLTTPTAGTFTYTYDGDGTIGCITSLSTIAVCSVDESTKTVTVTPIQPTSSTISVGIYATEGTNYTALGHAAVTAARVSVTITDGQAPDAPTITRTDYNTFTYTSSDDLEVTGYYVSTSDTTPAADANGWTTTTSYDISAAGTYYVWAKDAAGNVSSSSSISAYTITRAQGVGTTLVTRYDSTSATTGTEFTSTTFVVLDGTYVYTAASLNDGYNLLKFSINGAISQRQAIAAAITENTTFTTTAVATTASITINKDGSSYSGLTVGLYQSDTSKYSSPTYLSGEYTFSVVVDGTYDIYVGGSDTGIDVTVSGDGGSATVNYYTLTIRRGSGISSVSGAGTYLSGTSVSISATVSTGYTFSSWTVSGTSPVSTTSASTTVTIDAATTLTPNATANTYTIYYYNQDYELLGTSLHNVGVAKSLTTWYDFGGTVAGSGYGWEFAGWSTTTDSYSIAYTDGQSVSNLTTTDGGTVNLYAVYEREVYFYSEYGSDYDSSATQVQYWNPSASDSDTSISSITPPQDFPDSVEWSEYGWYEYGWTGSPDESQVMSEGRYHCTIATTCSLSYDSPNELYAMYGNAFIISYNANGGTGTMDSISSDAYTTVYDGIVYTYAGTASGNGFTRSGYEFSGWNTAADGTGDALYEGAYLYTIIDGKFSYSDSLSITLYAQWEAVGTYTINYYNGSASLGTSSHTVGTAKSLSTWETLSGSVDIYSSYGWEFAGWTTKAGAEENGYEVEYTDGQSVSNLTTTNGGTVNLYAIYKRTIYFYGDMATATSEVTYTSTTEQYWNTSGITSGTHISMVTTPDVVSLTGWSILGWTHNMYLYQYDEEDTYYNDGASEYIDINTQPKLYAFYSKDYTINYDANGGIGTKDSYVGKFYLTTLSPYACTTHFPYNSFFTREGYAFLGWNTDATATEAIYTTFDYLDYHYTDTSTSITLYAIWSPYHLYISHNVNGGTIASSTTSNGTTYSWSTDSAGNILLNGALYVQKLTYGGSLSSTGLPDWNNTSYMNISLAGYSAVSGAQWVCMSDNCLQDTYSMSTVYSASDFCDISSGDCTVTLGVNWQACTPTVSVSATTSAGTSTSSSSSGSTINATATVGNLCSGSVSSYGFLVQTSSTCPTTGYTESTSSSYSTVITTPGTYYVCSKVTASNGQVGYGKSSAITVENLGLGEWLRENSSTISTTLTSGLYRYSGTYASLTDNYVCFGTSTTSKCSFSTTHGGNNVYSYRIIGVDAAGRVKVIMTQTMAPAVNDDDPYVSDTHGDWTLISNINGSTFLTNTSYLASGWSDKIYTNTWNSTYTNKKIYSSAYKGSTVEGWQTVEGTFTKKVALMYVEDYFYATSLTESVAKAARSASWIHWTLNDPSATEKEGEWTLTDFGEWISTETGESTGWDATYLIKTDGQIDNYYGVLRYYRPVFFINSSVNYVSGSGTMSSPYIVS